MLQPIPIQTAVDHKFPAAHGKSLFDGQHGIGVILFHRVHLCAHGHILQRVEISQHHMGRNIPFFGVGNAPVGGDHHIVCPNGRCQRLKAAGTENDALFHAINAFPWSYKLQFIAQASLA